MAFRHGKHKALTREEQRERTERLSEETGKGIPAPPSSTASKPPLSRHTSAAHYAHANHASRRRRRIKHVLIALAIIVGAAVVAGAAYIATINAKLNSGVSTELIGSLTGTREPDEPFYMLLLGTDRDESRSESADFGSSDSAYRTDSIILARIDAQNKKVTLVSIHRDTMVDLGEHGKQKINAAYAIGGASYATEVISKFAGVQISHYAEADMDGMAAIVDQVGGIDVNLPMDVKDPNYTGLDLSAGEQHLDGQTAALLCRSRHAYDAYGDGDGYRAAAQRLVIEAVVQKVLASDTLTMMSTVQTLAGYVKTDMNVQSIVTLASEFVGMDSDSIMTGINPTTSAYINNVWYEISDDDAWKAMMKRVDAGESPTDPNAESDSSSTNSSSSNSGSSSDDSSDGDSSDSSESSSGSGSGSSSSGRGSSRSSSSSSNGYDDEDGQSA